MIDGIVLSANDVCMDFSSVRVLHDVDVQFQKARVYGVVGENGAGKSTLMRILSDFLQPTKGEIFVEGQMVHLNPLKAKALGIILIPQELNLVYTLRVYENVFLGDEIRGNFLLNKKAMIEKAKEYLDRFNLKIDPKSYVSQLSPVQKQMVEIVKAISNVMIAGEIDLSVGSMVALLGFVAIQVVNKFGDRTSSVVFSFVLNYGLAALLDFGMGLLTTKGKIPAFVTTLGGMAIYRSLDHGWTGGMVWWAQYAIKQYQNDPNVEFYLVTAKEPSEQIAQVQALLAKGIDALVINPYESAPLTPICVQAFRQEVFTVIVDRGINSEEYNTYFAGDNYMYGYLAGKYIAEKLKGKGNIVVIRGIPCSIDDERVKAFKDAISTYPDLKIIAEQPGYWSREKAFEVMQTLLTKFPAIDAVWTGDDDMLHGVLLALKQTGRDKNMVLVGGACEKNIVKMIMDSHPLIGVNFTYPPNMISTAINLAVMALRKQDLNGFYQRGIPRKIILATETVTKENAKDYYFPESVF